VITSGKGLFLISGTGFSISEGGRMTGLKTNLKCKVVYLGFLLFLISLFLTPGLFAANVTLSWTPPTTNADGTPLTDLAGYKLHSGTSSGNYTQNTDVGNVTSYTVTNLSGGTTYYFTLTAYDTSGNQSGFSNEISRTIAVSTYYCDKDKDGYINTTIDGTCSGTGCEPAGCRTTAGNDCNDNNANIHPGASDTNCNGIDENCDGVADNNYASTTTACGVGACSATGQNVCSNGAVVNTCTPGAPAASDTTCDGIDDNCNGQVDEGYAPTASSCGIGVCSAAGQNICQNGTIINTCTAGKPTGADDNCNGIDENCDGIADNNYASTTTACGAGACASTGVQQCSNGQLIDTCISHTPSAEVCDGSDNNCDGQVDEGCTSVIKVSKVLLTEDFADGIPNTWTKSSNWNTVNPCGENIDSPFMSPYAIVDSSCTGTGIEELVTPLIDASYCSDIQLTFSNQYHQNDGNVEVDISNDGGANWTNGLSMASFDGYPTPDWKYIDISNIAGTQNAKIKFRYTDNTARGFWALDNIWAVCQPAQLAFSSQAQMPSSAQTIIIANTGADNLLISAVGIEGTDASDFMIDSGKDTCSNKTLLPSKSCTLDVVFLPASAGTKNANLSITSNDPVTPALIVPLSGTGTAELVDPVPTIKANGATGIVNIKRGKKVVVKFELDPGSYVNNDADWWVLRQYGDNWKYYSAKTRKWKRGSSLYYQGPLVEIGPVKVFRSSSLSRGQYKFYFGVDTNMNGVPDPEEYYSDVVTVNVK
jgi:hypothetical protein